MGTPLVGGMAEKEQCGGNRGPARWRSPVPPSPTVETRLGCCRAHSVTLVKLPPCSGLSSETMGLEEGNQPSPGRSHSGARVRGAATDPVEPGAGGIKKMPRILETCCCLPERCRWELPPGPQGLGKMLCEVLKHILDCWAYINQQERSPKPRAAAQGPTTTGSSAGAPGRGEERVTRRMVFAHLECCVRFPGQCRCQQPPGERAPRLRGSIPFPKYG